jgi:hypothetical protein
MQKGNPMAAVHPVTQIELNTIEVERVSLDYQEAVTAHLMRLQGNKFSQIAHQLGTNPARLGEVFRGEKHPNARAAAEKILKAYDPRHA